MPNNDTKTMKLLKKEKLKDEFVEKMIGLVDRFEKKHNVFVIYNLENLQIK